MISVGVCDNRDHDRAIRLPSGKRRPLSSERLTFRVRDGSPNGGRPLAGFSAAASPAPAGETPNPLRNCVNDRYSRSMCNDYEQHIA